ncbi:MULTISPECIES: hypothetical protein [Neisseria]|uniref:Uncharacterized protein n=1 Tax=Neisseria wadsworthii 9715 TaxID=1030841 RepID=G4CMI2_9NEIS|nr:MULTISPECIES: hypothetical protein [Neisseria]EGZ51032.1 hypothetical protein HMPREF9370_0291 [Neisseria wadsworthii 9715]KPN72073.1 hypothetical protein AKG09_02560 [Neisseria sp. 83E34]QMT36316.1 hypothetical protein H3L96_03570 [Neisseria wadsworthii]
MKYPTKAAALTGILALFSSSAFATSPIPHEIYSPADAVVVRSELPGSGEFEVKFRVNSRHTSVENLAQAVRRHAKSHGFKEVRGAVQQNDADLKFKRKNQELDISIEQKQHGIIEYKADLELDKA